LAVAMNAPTVVFHHLVVPHARHTNKTGDILMYIACLFMLLKHQ